MKAAKPNRDWVWAAIGAVVLVAGALLLFRAPAPQLPEKPARGVTVGLNLDPAVRDEAAIFDPTPLFLPTKLNAAPKQTELRPPGSAFRDFEPKPVFAEMELKLDSLSLPKPVKDPPKPATEPGAVLALPSPGSLALGFGRTDTPVQALRSRGAWVEITAASDGRRVYAGEVAESERPPGGSATWEPMEFLAAVDTAGLVGPVVPASRSHVEEIDSFFQNYLAQNLHVGERLRPGFYRIRVGP